MSEFAVYIIVRRDLKMRRGKEIAQGIHAMAQLGYVPGLPLIVLRAETLDEILSIIDEAADAGVPTAFTRDAGKTEVPSGTLTAAAIGPVEKGRLLGLKGAQLY